MKRDYNSTVKKQAGAVTNKMYVIKNLLVLNIGEIFVES